MPKLPPSNFDPKMVSMLRSVLDAAVDQIDVAKRTPATKAKMAERILRAASDGVTDNEVLTAIAIQNEETGRLDPAIRCVVNRNSCANPNDTP
jgi:hypothetical protein